MAAQNSFGVVAGEQVVDHTTGQVEVDQRDYYNKATHYDNLWGADNIHQGFYPHLAGEKGVRVDNAVAAQLLTQRMIELAGIRHDSRVLDLGCGKGLACKVIAETTGAKCTGVDLTPANLARGRAFAAAHPQLQLRFLEGSFTDLPKELLNLAKEEKFTHVWSQAAFCHVHQDLPKIWAQAKSVLAPGGKIIVSDFLGGDQPPSKETLENLYRRMHFEVLVGHKGWRQSAEQGADLTLLHYENLDAHCSLFYRDMAEKARSLGTKSADGVSMAKNYDETACAVERGDAGLNLAIFSASGPTAAL